MNKMTEHQRFIEGIKSQEEIIINKEIIEMKTMIMLMKKKKNLLVSRFVTDKTTREVVETIGEVITKTSIIEEEITISRGKIKETNKITKTITILSMNNKKMESFSSTIIGEVTDKEVVVIGTIIKIKKETTKTIIRITNMISLMIKVQALSFLKVMDKKVLLLVLTAKIKDIDKEEDVAAGVIIIIEGEEVKEATMTEVKASTTIVKIIRNKTRTIKKARISIKNTAVKNNKKVEEIIGAVRLRLTSISTLVGKGININSNLLKRMFKKGRNLLNKILFLIK